MFSNVPMVAVSRGPCKPRSTSMARSYFWLFADRMGVVIRDMDRVLNSRQHIPGTTKFIPCVALHSPIKNLGIGLSEAAGTGYSVTWRCPEGC